MKKRIIFIINDLGFGGAQKFLITLLNSLNLEKFDVAIVSLSNNNTLKSELRNSINLIELPRNTKFDINHLIRLRRIILEKKSDCIFCIGFFCFFLATISMLFCKRKFKNIISYHTTIQPNRKQVLLIWLYSKLLREKDIIVTVSKNQANYTAKKYRINKTFFKTIHNGINTKYWYYPKTKKVFKEIRDRFDIPETSNLIVIAAGLRPEKNHINAIKALKILHESYDTKAYLLLVGDGIMRKRIEILTNQLGINQFVKFAGFQSDVRSYYWSSNLFALCSDKVETFSIAALEAMACGLPAVITNIGGANEMIVDNENGFLCDPSENDIAEKWFKALNSKFSPTAIMERIHRDFDQEKMVLQYEKILES
jgi:glycosyltransferase involved in cell wall biosynthesis